MRFAQHDDVMEAFPPNRADHTFSVRVLPGRSWRDQDLSDGQVLEPVPEIAAVDRILIPNQVLGFAAVSGERFDNLLRRPLFRGVSRDVEVNDPPAIVGEDHETVEQSERGGRNDEEVAGSSAVHVVVEEGAPGLGRGPPSAMTDYVLGDRGFRDLNLESQT